MNATPSNHVICEEYILGLTTQVERNNELELVNTDFCSHIYFYTLLSV